MRVAQVTFSDGLHVGFELKCFFVLAQVVVSTWFITVICVFAFRWLFRVYIEF